MVLTEPTRDYSHDTAPSSENEAATGLARVLYQSRSARTYVTHVPSGNIMSPEMRPPAHDSTYTYMFVCILMKVSTEKAHHRFLSL